MPLSHSAVLSILGVFLAFTLPATASEPSPFFFGLSNEDGTQVVFYENYSHTPPQMYAVLTSGKNCLLSFLEKRDRRPEDSGRETADNFANLAGVIFHAPGGCLKGDQTVIALDPKHLDKHQPLPVRPNELSPLTSTDISRIETMRKLKIQHSWNLASLGSDEKVALVQFAPQKDGNVACLALISKEKIAFEDYVGKTNDSAGVWRVGDGGEFGPGDFRILAAFRSSRGIELVRAWAGPEGENSVLLREDGTKLSAVLSQYRYWAAR